MSQPNLSSDRLTYRRVTKEDASQVFFLRSDKGVNKYIQRKFPETISDAEAFITKTNKSVDENTLFYWAINLNETSDLIGSICLWNISEDKKTAEVGYDLHPSFQKKGYMDEAIKTIIQFGLNEINLNAIEAFTHKENMPSKKLLTRNGFQLEENRVDEGFPHNAIFRLEKTTP